MIRLTHTVAGQELPINVVENSPSDLFEFATWLQGSRSILAVDTETSGLDIYSPDFNLRLVQFGDADGAYVLDAATLGYSIGRALYEAPRLVAHNAAYDLLVLDAAGMGKLETVGPKTVDTRILSHLIDPRGREDGGVGHRLKDLAVKHVDRKAQDGQTELKAVFAANGWDWATIPVDNETYCRYAGLDTILTARLYDVLLPKMKGQEALCKFEHALMRALAKIQRRGMRTDVTYLEQLSTELGATQVEQEQAFQRLIGELGLTPLSRAGCRALTNGLSTAAGLPTKANRCKGGPWQPPTVGSNDHVVRALLAMGEELDKETKSGKLAVDKDVLNRLCDVDKDGERVGNREPNPLAQAVKAAKRAGKWKSSYVDAMLTTRDARDRVHPSLGGLQARTARMSVSRPPFQQLPSSGHAIRDGVIADEGMVIIACDYKQVELRVLAAMADEIAMQQAIFDGKCLHAFTAENLFGPGFTPRQRKLAKIVGLGVCYGGGAKGLAEQSGTPLPAVQAAVNAYDESFPGVKQYGRRLQNEARKNDFVTVTPIGRRLPVDEDRLYAVLNYQIQSSARDVFAQALLRLEAAGLGEFLLLPVHDEMIAQAPVDQAEEIAKEIASVMTCDFMGVPIDAEHSVYGPRWGDGYRLP